jgi:hypothetical protein
MYTNASEMTVEKVITGTRGICNLFLANGQQLPKHSHAFDVFKLLLR